MNCQDRVFPSSERRGGCASKKKARSLRSGADGVVIMVHVDVVTLSRTDHPVCAFHKEASQHILEGAATPPLRGGEHPSLQFIHTFYDRRCSLEPLQQLNGGESMSPKVKCLVNILLISAFTCTAAWGQATAQISGTVRDQSSAVLPGAEITATQTETGIARNTVSDETGSFNLPNLALGPYRIEVALPGFRTYVQTGIVLQVNSNPVINAVLEVGQVTETVEVQANAAMVETRSVGIAQVIENERIMELPLNGRNVTELITLTAGAVQAGLPAAMNFDTGRFISVNGGVGYGVSYNLDGAPHTDQYSGLGQPFPFPDALQEFKVETSGVTAQNGGQSGAYVNSVTKSGTNELHGDLFEFVRNDLFNATNYFAAVDPATGKKVRSTLKRNQFGGTLGGPIMKNKLFFFGGYQGTTTRQDPASTRA